MTVIPQEGQDSVLPYGSFRYRFREWCWDKSLREARALSEYIVEFTDRNGSIGARIRVIASENGISEEACLKLVFSQPNAAAVITFLNNKKK